MTPPCILFLKGSVDWPPISYIQYDMCNMYEDRLASSTRSTEEIKCIKCQDAGQFSRICLKKTREKKSDEGRMNIL